MIHYYITETCENCGENIYDEFSLFVPAEDDPLEWMEIGCSNCGAELCAELNEID